MRASQLSLRRLCRNNCGTPTEIVSAAWRWALDDKISSSELLTRCDESIRLCVVKSASTCAKSLLPDSLGIVIGSARTLLEEIPSNMIPRDFIEGLADKRDNP